MGTDGKFPRLSLRTNQKLQETFRLSPSFLLYRSAEFCGTLGSLCLCGYLLLLFTLTGLSRCENVSWASFHLPFSLVYTSVTIKGLVTSCSPTTACKSMSSSRMAVLPNMRTSTAYTAAFLYQMPPLLMVASS